MFTSRPRSLSRRLAFIDFCELFEALPDAVLAVRADPPAFTIAAASDAYLKATHTQRDGSGHASIIGRGLFDVFPAAPYARGANGMSNLRASLERVIETGESDRMPPQRYDIRRADGSWEERHWSPLNVPVRDTEGHVEYVLHEVVDITEIVQLTERASTAERESSIAQEANASKAQLLATISHELRTPLNAIGGFAQLLTMGIHGPVTDEQRGVLERIRRSEQHLLALVNEVLGYAKIEAGRESITVAPLPLAPILRDAVELLTPQARARGIELRLDPAIDDDCAITAMADAEKLERIIVNLLANAIKCTAAKGRVTVGCHTSGDLVLIDVSDTGIGIAPADLTRIFEPFVQAGRPRAGADGVGLGLAISRGLARAMGGDVVARSELGRGSTFEIMLPRHEERRRTA